MKRFAVVAFLVGIVGMVGFAGAAKPDPDPTGTWKFTTKFGKKDAENTLKLTYKDGKLTGTLTSPGFGGGKETESKIEDGKYEKGELSFTVTREIKDNKFATKYEGKVADDTIKGTITSKFGDKEFKQDWEAKRSKDK